MKALRLWWFFVSLAAGATAISFHAGAQPYPNKPLRIVVPAPPGSPSDTMARIIGAKLAANLGQQVVVENRPGAGGRVGFDSVVKAPPDGYTMLLGDISALMLSAPLTSKPLDLARDVTPVSLVSQVPTVLLISSSLPVKSVRELIDLAKARPDQLAFASAGSGGQGHFVVEQFKALSRTSIRNIPFRGAGEVLTALMGSQVQMAFVPVTVAKPLAREGKLRILAITGDKRSTFDPELPTFAEAGLRGFDVASQYGVLLPPGAPREIATQLNAALVKIVRTSDTREQFAKIGAEPTGTSPEQLAAYVREGTVKWAWMVREGGGGGAPPPVAVAPPPPPPPPVAVAPPAPTPPQKAQIQDAYWNSWFERGGVRVARLEKDKEFTFNLDLSQYQYRIGQSAVVDPETLNKLKEAIDLNQKQIRFVIRPILVGGALEFADEPASLRIYP